jgi:hypothetical protein
MMPFPTEWKVIKFHGTKPPTSHVFLGIKMPYAALPSTGLLCGSTLDFLFDRFLGIDTDIFVPKTCSALLGYGRSLITWIRVPQTKMELCYRDSWGIFRGHLSLCVQRKSRRKASVHLPLAGACYIIFPLNHLQERGYKQSEGF